jgi:alpha-ribazole phosphatase
MIGSSPAARAVETAEIMSGTLRVELMEIYEDLHERNLGALDGQRLDHIDAKQGWAVPYDQETMAGGESLMSVGVRVAGVLEELLDREGDVIVVTHGGVMRALAPLFGLCQPDDAHAMPAPRHCVPLVISAQYQSWKRTLNAMRQHRIVELGIGSRRSVWPGPGYEPLLAFGARR